MMRRLLPLLMLLLALPACGGGGDSAGGIAPYAATDAKALLDAGAFNGEMEEVKDATVLMIYGIDESTVTDCACYMASNTSVSADEVTVLVLVDEAAAETAVTACQQRVESQIDSCADYCPDQVPRLEDAVISRRANTVLLAVGDPEALPGAMERLGL